MAIIKRCIVCEMCGGPVGLHDAVCPYCGSGLELLGDVPYALPGVRANENAKNDAVLVKRYVDSLESLGYMRPMDVDEILDVLKALKDHCYPYRYYILETISLTLHFRSICMDQSQEKRTTHLEIIKRLDAILGRLTT